MKMSKSWIGWSRSARVCRVSWVILALALFLTDQLVIVQGSTGINSTRNRDPLGTTGNYMFHKIDTIEIVEANGSNTGMHENGTTGPQAGPDRRAIIYTGYVTESQMEVAYLIIIMVILPLVTMGGISGNILSFLIFWWKKRARTVAMKFLMIMALSDTLVLLLGLLLVIVGVLHYTDPVAEQNLAALGFAYTGWFMFSLGSNITVSLTLLSTLERFIAVFFPFKARGNILQRFQNIIIIVICFVNLGVALPLCWKYEVIKIYHTSLKSEAYFMTGSDLLMKTNFFPLYDLTTAIIFRYGPMFLLFTFNIAIIVKVRESMKFRSNLQEENQNGPGGKSQQEIQITRILVTVSLVFCACKIPICVSRILALFIPGFSMLQKEHFLYEIFTWSNLTSECINSAVNFLIYMYFSDSFRVDLKNLLCCRVPIERGFSATSQNTVTSVAETSVDVSQK